MKSSKKSVDINQSWAGFDWDNYPGGVQVSVALVYGQALLLTKPERWRTTMPSFCLQKGQVLADAWALYVQQLVNSGVSINISGVGPEVRACYSDGRTYHVLIMVSCQRFGPIAAFERVCDALLLSGYASDCVMASFAAHAMRWGDASRHLPLPDGASLWGEKVPDIASAPAIPVTTANKSRSRTVPMLAAATGQ